MNRASAQGVDKIDVSSGNLALLDRLRASQGVKLLRFGAVSAFNLVFGQVLLYGAQTVLHLSPVVSNVLSVSVVMLPAYILSRYWVWEKRGKNHVVREVLPFWVLNLAGFAVSTAAVWFVADRWSPSPLSINLTALASFAVVWIVKFFVLDRLLFGVEGPAAA